MTGLNPVTGRAVDPQSDDYIRLAVADILTTPIGSRVMRRDYGSYLPDLVDQPLNSLTRIKLYGATALALLRWLSIARLKTVRLETENGQSVLRLLLERTDTPQPRTLPITLPLTAARL